LTDALAEQPRDRAQLARADHDQVGAALVGDVDDRVGRLTDRRLELRRDALAREVLVLPNACANSAARSSARRAGSVSS
jgi:hypothetical protein